MLSSFVSFNKHRNEPACVCPRKVSTAPLAGRLFLTTFCPTTAEDSRPKSTVLTNSGARKPRPYVALPSYERLNVTASKSIPRHASSDLVTTYLEKPT
jgi:hypothetical protein